FGTVSQRRSNSSRSRSASAVSALTRSARLDTSAIAASFSSPWSWAMRLPASFWSARACSASAWTARARASRSIRASRSMSDPRRWSDWRTTSGFSRRMRGSITAGPCYRLDVGQPSAGAGGVGGGSRFVHEEGRGMAVVLREGVGALRIQLEMDLVESPGHHFEILEHHRRAHSRLDGRHRLGQLFGLGALGGENETETGLPGGGVAGVADHHYQVDGVGDGGHHDRPVGALYPFGPGADLF